MDDAQEEKNMTYRLRRFTIALLVGSLLLALGASQGFALQVGDKAPTFDLQSTTGENVKLEDYLGKKSVVLFFYIGAFTKG
jgi:cytochrome oxidase Cu insertion factor (SCO1/SenC/PrrC family)